MSEQTIAQIQATEAGTSNNLASSSSAISEALIAESGVDTRRGTTPNLSDDMRVKISKMLNLPDGIIELHDNIDDLYLIGPRPGVDPIKYGHFRLIIDMQKREIVARFFPVAPVIVNDDIRIDDGEVILTDINRNQHRHELKNVKFLQEEMGPQLIIFKHAGIIYRATTKKINADRSRWNGSKPFATLYNELGGPDPNSLFSEKAYSPVTYTYILVAPRLTTATKRPIGHGYTVYLGPTVMSWRTKHVSEWPYPADQVDTSIASVETDPIPNLDKPNLIAPRKLTYDEANMVLRYGYVPETERTQIDKLYEINPRMGSGESVIVYFLDERGRMLNSLKIRSRAFRWREMFRARTASIDFRVAKLYTSAQLDMHNAEDRRTWMSRFPPIKTSGFLDPEFNSITGLINRIKRDGPILHWPQTVKAPMPLPNESVSNKFYRLVVSFMLSVPLHSQLAVLGAYIKFIKNHKALVAWFMELNNESNIEDSEYDDRVIAVLMAAREMADINISEGRNKSAKGKTYSKEQLVNIFIRRELNKRDGRDLYKFFKIMLGEDQAQNSNAQPTTKVPIGGQSIVFGAGR